MRFKLCSAFYRPRFPVQNTAAPIISRLGDDKQMYYGPCCGDDKSVSTTCTLESWTTWQMTVGILAMPCQMARAGSGSGWRPGRIVMGHKSGE